MKVHIAMLQAFVAVHFTVVVPIGNVEPEARSHDTVVPKPPPTGTGKFTTAPLPVESALTSVGQVIVGASPTLTENEHVASPPAFVARQFTVDVPRAKFEPEGGVQTNVTPIPVVVAT